MEDFLRCANPLYFPAFFVAAPLLALGIAHLLWKTSPPILKIVVCLCVTWILMELALTLTTWSLVDFWPKQVALKFSCFCGILLLVLARKVEQKRRRLQSLTASLLLLATMLYVLWNKYGLFDNYGSEDALSTEVKITDQVFLYRSSGGMFTINWEGVKIVYRPRYAPFLEKTLYQIHIGETEDCNEKTVHVMTDLPAHEARVQCGTGKAAYIWQKVWLP